MPGRKCEMCASKCVFSGRLNAHTDAHISHLELVPSRAEPGRGGGTAVLLGAVDEDAAEVFAGVHVGVALVDGLERVRAGDEFVELELSVCVHTK